MYIGIILKAVVLKDVKQAAEEISSGVLMYTQVVSHDFGYAALNRGLSVIFPLMTAYIVHKLKKNYWENDLGFFPVKLIVKDLKQILVKKKQNEQKN